MKGNIYIFSEVEIRRSGSYLSIGGKRVPLSVIEALYILTPKGRITQGALSFLLKQKRPIYLFDRRFNLYGQLLPHPFQSNYRLRLAQYRSWGDLGIGKLIILRKIEGIEQVIGRRLGEARARLERAETLQQLLGVEGQASTLMFKRFRQELEKEGITCFKSREYRPPPDPVNGLLSFLYTLYYGYIVGQLIGEGFDPYIGFLHLKRGDHAVLASDLMEPVRPQLTWLALELLPTLYPTQFEGVHLTSAGGKVVVSRFEEFLEGHQNRLIGEVKGILLERSREEERGEISLKLPDRGEG
jgi:CRISPR-associated protein Cas1